MKLLCLLFLFLCISISSVYAMEGVVVDAKTQAPIKSATVNGAGKEVKTDEKGYFQFSVETKVISVRALGYLRATHTFSEGVNEKATIALTPFKPKALYLTVYGIGNKNLRDNALKLISETKLNALVIDVKGDRGFIPYSSNIKEAHEIGAQKIITVANMPTLLAQLHAKGIYLIARIVVFKDNILASTHPEFAVRDKQGQPWHDRESLGWVDPFMPEVWQYNIAIAMEAAQMGFDEIQFDYVRFPDAKGLKFSKANTAINRVAAITGFLREAKKQLGDYNVFVSADIFGYVCWNTDDTAIGQQLEELVSTVDYVSPMLYPSGFSFGIPGLRDPMKDPNKIVLRSLQNALRRTGVSGIHFRPWLQAFHDYAFDHRSFGEAEIKAQIEAADAVESDGWMLWNSHNTYTDSGLLP